MHFLVFEVLQLGGHLSHLAILKRLRYLNAQEACISNQIFTYTA